MTKWGKLLGRVYPVPQDFSPTHLAVSPREENALVGKAIARACRLLPWSPSCLAQAFAGQRIFRSRKQPGIVVIGLRPEGPSQWPAHAWLVRHGQIVTGAEIAHQYFPASLYAFEDPGADLRTW